jgi:hypothetical protein
VAAALAGVWVDLDQGQLLPENLGQNYPLPFDVGVVLIDFEEVDWQDQGAGVQEGAAVIRFTLARQVVQDTYTFTGQAGRQRAPAMQQLQLLGELHQALQHYAADGKQFGALVRTASRKEPSLPGLWVYSMAYKCRLYDTGGYQGGGVATVPDVATAPVRSTGRPARQESGIILP